MGKRNPRVWDLGDGKKKPLGFGTLVMGKKTPRVWDLGDGEKKTLGF